VYFTSRRWTLTISKVGFFRELRHGSADGPSICDHRCDSARPDESRIVRYLNAAATLAATGSMADDALDATKRAVARLETATDGRWISPRDLAYYVNTYHVVLPSEFVEHMRMSSWNPPGLSREDLIRVEDELFMKQAFGLPQKAQRRISGQAEAR
jgi:hypothetical protein